MSGPTVLMQHPPRVESQVFIGVAWGGVVLSLIFFLGRVYARLSAYRRLYWDDALVLASWMLFCSSTIIWTVVKDKMYENLMVSSGRLWPLPATLPEDTTSYVRATLAVIIFFYASLWAIKFSFLIFFRRLGSKVRNQKIHWWIVFSITMATWITTFGLIQYDCLLGSFEHLVAKCTAGQRVVFQRATLRSNMVFDVVTDAMIMTIPISLLWNVRISMKKKLALMGLFSLTLVTILFAIIRVVVVSSQSYMPDQSWMYLWSSIEQTVAIIIACLASFRSLFTKSESGGAQKLSGNKDRSLFSSWAQRFMSGRFPSKLGSKFSKSWGSSRDQSSSGDSASETQMIESKPIGSFVTVTRTASNEAVEHRPALPQAIYVKREFRAMTQPTQPQMTTRIESWNGVPPV